MGAPTTDPMPAWPPSEGNRCITIELDSKIVMHLDEQASYLGCSRAFYIRKLFLKDMRRQKPAEIKI